MSTAGTPIKFRCSNCGKNLGVSRSKAGMLVACPRCETEQVVPEPPPEAVAVAESADADPAALFRNLVETRPAPSQTAPPRPAEHAVAADPEPAPFLGLNLGAAPAPPAPPIRTEPAPRVAPAVPTPTPPASPGFPMIQTEAPAAPVASAFPTIRAEPDPIRPESVPRVAAPTVTERVGARRNDVILPRTAVVLWSFTMLLLVVLAFAVGLLLGHFIWVKPPA